MKNEYQHAVTALALALLVCSAAPVLAAEKAEEGVVDFVKKVVEYPVTVTGEVGGAVVNLGKNTEEGWVDFTETTGEVLSGDVSKTPDLVVKPATKAVEGTGELIVDTATAPVKAAQSK